jgi:hypothetical protein
LSRLLLVGIVFLASAIVGRAQPPASSSEPESTRPELKVVHALDRLDAWLGDNPNGDRWRRFLHTEELRRELQKGADADPAVVAAAVSRFSAPAPGLNLPRFLAVRNSLREWQSDLQKRRPTDLPELALAARTDHAAITDAQLATVRGDLRARAAALLQMLGGNTKLAQNWQKYLKWDQLQPHLSDDFQVTRRSLTELDEVLRRLRANQPGLELPAFVDLAKSIGRYRPLASWALGARSRDSQAAYDRLLSSISTELERHMERPTTETAWQVGRILGVLDGLGQSPQFVSAVRQRLVKPNVEATISSSFVERMPERRANEVRPVRDCILGTTIIGTACTSTEVEYGLNSSPNSIALAIHLTGGADSNNNGYNGPVRIKTRGRTNYSASSNLFLNNERFIASPVVAMADTHTHIQSINKTGGQFGARLVQKIAWRRAGEQKGQAERISSRHTEERVTREFTETVERDLGIIRQRYEREVRAPLIRRGIQPEYLLMRSEPNAAFIETILAGRNQLGADRVAPRPRAGSDVMLRVHESAVNNYLALALASVRISQEEANVAPALEGDVPNWIKLMSITRPKLAAAAATGAEIVEEAQDTITEVVQGQADEREEDEPKAPPFKPYSITLNAEAPASVRFDDGKLTVRVRASRLMSDDAEYFNWDFIVTYQMTTRDDRILLRRVGDIEVFPTGFDPAWDTQLTAQQSGFRSTLAKNMNARARTGQGFPSEIPIEPIRTTRFGTLLLHELQADEGWLTISWVLPPTMTAPLVPPRPGAALTPPDAPG